MTMAFLAPQAGVPRNVGVGDSVVFSFRKTPDDRYQLTSIAPSPTAVPAASMPASRASGAKP